MINWNQLGNGLLAVAGICLTLEAAILFIHQASAGGEHSWAASMWREIWWALTNFV